MCYLVVLMERDATSNPEGKKLKITDFDHVRKHECTKTMSKFGTYSWMSFEVIETEKFSKKSDVYR